MKNALILIRNIICYCGLSKEEYRDIKKEAYVNNFLVWKYLHVFLIIAFSALTVVSSSGVDSHLINVRMAMMGYFAVMSLLFYFVLKEDSLIAQFAIYLTMVVLLLYGMYNGLEDPGMPAVAFEVLLILLPMFMIDKPYFLILVLSLASAVYLVHAQKYKLPDIYQKDLVNTILYSFFGMNINTFYNFIRIREFKHKENADIALDKTKQLNTTLRNMSEGVIELLGEIVENRDNESGEHIRRVKGFTYILANQIMKDCPEYNLDEYTVKLMTSASALHDVGKIAISDTILLKPGRLTEEEFNIMKTHCEKGVSIIDTMRDTWSEDYLEMGISICLNHHEKWDGSGYPSGLRGDSIPIAAQIVSIADIYDALTTKRVYKDAYSYEKAFNMIINGECGEFSERMKGCLLQCKDAFEKHAENPSELKMPEIEYDITETKKVTGTSYVVGIHDETRSLNEKMKLYEEVSVLGSLTDNFYYICYVDMLNNEVIRFKAEESFAKILDSYSDQLKSYERFDKLLNSIIVAEDFKAFQSNVERYAAIREIQEKGSLETDFRIRLEDGTHYCRMKICKNDSDENSVIIGIFNRDAIHEKEKEYSRLQEELELTRKEVEDREKLADRLAVINSIADEYDYVCSLNTDTMDVVVYKAEDWIKDMFKNLEDIVTSPESRDTMLKGIIFPEDFEKFKEESKHESVVKALAENGRYYVNYRAYKYGEPVLYQTHYSIDPDNPKRIIIGLHLIEKLSK